MDRYGTILVSPPGGKGRRVEGIIDGALYPGTCLSVKSAVEPVNGRFTYEAWNRDADGARGIVAVLLEDYLQGKGVTEAYTSGSRGFIYYPQAGDLLQMLVANITGTGDTFAIGDQLIIDDTTGKLVATTGTPEREAFEIRETVSTALTADTLVLCEYTGS